MSEAITSTSGWAQVLLKHIFESDLGNCIIQLQACTLGEADAVIDLFNLENKEGCIVDSGDCLAFGKLAAMTVTDYSQVVKALHVLVENVEDVVGSVRNADPDSSQVSIHKECECPCSPYDPSHVVFSIKKFENQEAVDEGCELNSIHFVVLGDSERPPLCGIHINYLEGYSWAHKTHTAVVSMLGAIRTGRLRIPFNKSTLTSLLKRAYNQERGYRHNADNKPTQSFVFIFAVGDGTHAEETYHSLITGKRITTVTGSGGIGPASRDLEAEQWRLEQDIVDLKDELQIAKAVHDYKPCIYGQPKKVQDIGSEEGKRMVAIKKKQEETRARAAEKLQEQTKQEAKEILEKEEAEYTREIKSLEDKLDEKLKQNAEMNASRDKKVKSWQKEVEKNTRKRDEEEQDTLKLKAEVKEMEDKLAASDLRTKRASKKIEFLKAHAVEVRRLLNKDVPYGQERAELVAKLKADRDAGLQQIDAEGSEEADHSVSESMAQQLEDLKATREKASAKKDSDEQARADGLEAALALYKARISEHEMRTKRDELHQALKMQGNNGADALMQKVMQFLQSGCRMSKIPNKGSSAKKRYFFISEDYRKILSCEMDDLGMPINRQKPSTSVNVKDIQKVVLGQFTESFLSYGRAANKNEWPSLLDDEKGSYNAYPTPDIDSNNVHKYFHRSLSFEFKEGKTIDLVADSDTDFECWVMALRWMLKGETQLVEWGTRLELSEKPGADRLDADERALCSRSHMMPLQFHAAKQDALQQYTAAGELSIYDIRACSTLDLARAQDVHDFLLAKNLIKG
uniref:PH domain-containing protein n=1 Tax=Eutreptiella gymnastica TaxID=73025 RepID=A0A7S4LDR7_9EUGL